jgi:dTDP-4-dehydrorhamnose reductase
MFQEAKILVIGKHGLLASSIQNIWGKDHNIIFLSRLDLDISLENKVNEFFNTHSPNIVINTASLTDLDNLEKSPDSAYKINGECAGIIARACKLIGATLIHVSTGQVFNGESKGGYLEEDEPSPINVYGKSKLEGEKQVLNSGCNSYITRISWLFSNTFDGFSSIKKPFPLIVKELCSREAEIKMVDDEFGLPTYTKDYLFGIKSLVENQKPFGIYHLTNSGDAPSRYDWAKQIIEILGFENSGEPIFICL